MRKLFRLLLVIFVIGTGVYRAFHGPGTKLTFGNGEVYYKDGATQEEAQKVGEALQKDGYFGDHTAAVQVTREGNKHILSLVVKDGYWDDSSKDSAFILVGSEVARAAFPAEEVELRLSDDNLNSHKSFPIVLVNEKVVGKSDVLYANGITAEQADATAKIADNFSHNGITVTLTQESGLNIVSFVVKEGMWDKESIKSGFQALGQEIQKEAFKGAKTEVHLCDKFLVKKTVVKL